MIGSAVALGCRALVTMVFVLTAVWKVSNRSEFDASFERLAPRRLAGHAPLALMPLAMTELLLGATMMVGIWVQGVSVLGPAAAFILIATFTVALALGEDGGCGCWSAPAEEGGMAKLVPILRNVALLVALIGAGLLSPHGIHGISFVAGAAPFATGLIAAMLLVEAPQLVAVASFQRATAEVAGD